MKKIVSFSVLFFLSFFCFSQEKILSIGGSIGLSGVFNENSFGNSYDGLSIESRFLTLSPGLFFDAKFVTVSADYTIVLGEYGTTVSLFESGKKTTQVRNQNLGIHWLDLTVMGKFPFTLGTGFDFYPLVGLTYSFNLLYNDTTNGVAKGQLSDQAQWELNEVYLNAGLGTDFNLGTESFLRLQYIIAYNLDSKKTDIESIAKTYNMDYLSKGLKQWGQIGWGFRI